MKFIFLLSFLFACSIGAITAQPIKFTSVYTDVLGNKCKSQENENAEGDGSMICPAIDGYELFVYYNFYGHEIIQVQSVDPNNKYSEAIPLDHCEDSHQYGAKIEWRLANGEPFAFIIRVSCFYAIELNEEELRMNYTGFEARDQYLVIVGLSGYEKIREEITVKASPNANKAARAIADSAFLHISEKD